MKCPSCNTYVTKIPISWKCPHCNAKLPDPSRWYLIYDYWVNYFQDKGSIFWSVWFGVLLLFVGAFEVLLGGPGALIGYFSRALFLSIFGIFFTGMLIDMVMKINLPLRSQSGGDFIINERKVIRNIRKGTNLAGLAGLIYATIWLGPAMFLEYFPSYAIVIGWFLAIGWAIIGMFLDGKMAEDVRFRLYMERLGITNLKAYRRLGTIMIGVLIVTAIAFHVLVARHGLWASLSNTAFIGSVIFFFKNYFGWIF